MIYLEWTNKLFADLSLDELYEIMALRQEVFVVEQNCPYLDADGKDPHSYHLMGYLNNQLVAYARILPPGISYLEISIGRILTHSSVRRSGYGKELMDTCHAEIRSIFGHGPVRISAQSYLRRFYENVGYEFTGKEYLEDGIPHMEMLKTD